MTENTENNDNFQYQITDDVFSSGETNQPQKKKLTKKFKAKIIFSLIFIIGANLLFMFMMWLISRYDGSLPFDQIWFTFKSPLAGANKDLVGDALQTILINGFSAATIEIGIYFLLAGKIKPLAKKFARYAKYSASKFATFLRKRFFSISTVALILIIVIFILVVGIPDFTVNLIVESDLIEEEYVDPDEAEIIFPEQKRNLIYIFLESMEYTFADENVGGNITEDLIPELSLLAEENISFYHSKEYGNGYTSKYGALPYIGTTWTAAALFAQTSGIILKVPMNLDVYGENGNFVPGISTLGDVLEAQGYQQSILFGSDGAFAARDVYFEQHGNFNVIDIYDLNEYDKNSEDGFFENKEDYVDEDGNYWRWWGCEDRYIFEYAKIEIERLAASGQPFNFMTLTADTHFPDGFLCDVCGDEHDNQYSNVISCSSKQVYEFVEWIKAQPFYENTTIVISGDHLTMDPNFLEDIDEGYVRTNYNCIINSAIDVSDEIQGSREFGTFDMFPTTLAAMGVTIKGDRLGIGTNLFSTTQTLTEKYGHETLEDELSKYSEFYFETFYEEKGSEEEEEGSENE